MKNISKALLDLTAEDLMTRAVVTIPQNMSLGAAARLLARSQVTGAPVVDGEGRCVGVLSSNDFVSWFAGRDEPARVAGPGWHAHMPWELLDQAALPADEVSCHMTVDPVTVTPEVGIGELAWMMVDAHIHRVIVVDGDRRPIGIVSSTDLLAAVGNADEL